MYLTKVLTTHPWQKNFNTAEQSLGKMIDRLYEHHYNLPLTAIFEKKQIFWTQEITSKAKKFAEDNLISGTH